MALRPDLTIGLPLSQNSNELQVVFVYIVALNRRTDSKFINKAERLKL